MMNEAEKRRALKNALERLRAAGSHIEAVSDNRAAPLITVEFPPVWLITKSTEIRERINGDVMVSYVARLSGCLVRWIESDMSMSYRITQHLNQYSPELINSWPKNF